MSDKPTGHKRIHMRSASWVFGSQIASLLASAPLSVVIARVLEPSGKGTLSIVQLTAGFSAIVMSFGLGQAFTYYAARGEARGRDSVRLAYGVGASVSVFLGLLWIPLGSDLASALHISDPRYVLVGLLLSGPAIASQYLNAYVFGTGAIRNASLVNIIALYFQLAAVTLLAAVGHLTQASAIGVWVVAVLGACGVFTALAWSGQIGASTTPGSIVLLKRMWRYGVSAWPAGILGTAAQRFDVFLLAFFRSPAEVGLYSIAVTLAELCWYVPNAIGSVLIPKVASEGDDGLAVTLRTGRVIWLVTAATALLVVAVGAPLIPIVFGDAFKGSVLPLVCIVPGIVISSMSTAAGAFLAGIGRPLDTTKAAGVNVVVNTAANVVLIPAFGASGAALASSISYAAGAAVVIWLFTRHTRTSVSDLLVPRREDIVSVVGSVRTSLRKRYS